MRRHAAAGQPGALATQLDEAHDGLGKVIVGGKLQRVHAGAGQRGAQVGLALGGEGGEALAEARAGGVDQQLLAGFGVAQGQPAVPLTASIGTLWVATTGTPYPLQLNSSPDQPEVSEVTFTEWNKKVVIKAPPKKQTISLADLA